MRMLLVRIMSAIYKYLYKSDFYKDTERNFKRIMENEALKSRVTFLEGKIAERNIKLVQIINNFSQMMKSVDVNFKELDLIRDVEIMEIKKMFGGEK